MATLDIQIIPQAAPPRVRLVGSITEQFEYARLLSDLPKGEVIVDLSGICRVNSSGTRQWIEFVNAVPHTTTLILEQCSFPFFYQACMISSFLGKSRMESFYLPYLCTSCGRTEDQMVRATDARQLDTWRTRKCSSCQSTMTVDVIEDMVVDLLKVVHDGA